MPGLATVADLLAMHRALGIDRAVVVQASPQGTDNGCLLDALEAIGMAGREVRGVAVVGEDVSRAELEALRSGGVRGLRVNLESHGHSNAVEARRKLLVQARLAADLGLHLQMYTNLGMVKAVAPTLKELPVPVVIDHFALASPRLGQDQDGLRQLSQLLESGRVYLKVSAPYRILERFDAEEGRWLVRMLVDANPERLLWGTDWPHTGPWPGKARLRDRPEPFHPIDNGEQLNLLGRWTSEQERLQILVRNPARLFGFLEALE
ncbi:putative TIM-barrel fold metal-dependent hydrolase [Variovorax paradoxus]|nr:putative TIM-barrel fold metal-dependent hydrolase [Variovorax paradoxus]